MTSSPDREAGLLTPTFLRILAVQLAFGLSYSAFLLLPKFLRVELQASSTTIGWVAAASVIAAAIFAPLVGLLGTRVPRLLVLGSGMVGTGIAAIGFGFIDHMGPSIYILRGMQGFAWAAITTVTATMAADCVPRDRLAQGIGYLGLSMLITNALAPAVTEPLAEIWGWTPAFVGAGVLALLSLALFPKLPRSSPVEAVTEGSSNFTPRLLSIHYAALVMGAGIGVMFTFTQPFALEVGASRVGDFFFGYVAAAVFVRIVLARWADQVGPARISAYALILYSLVVFLTSQLRPVWLLPLGLGLGVSHGFLYPSLTAAGLSQLPAHARSLFVGWFSCAFNVGFGLSVLLLGPLADRKGFPIVFLTVGTWLATAILPLLWTHRSTPSTLTKLAS